jgi:hypothetical protein
MTGAWEKKNRSPAPVLRETCQPDILLDKTLNAIKEKEADIAPFQGLDSPHDRVSLQALIDPASPADAGRVDEQISSPLVLNQGVHTVLGCPRDIGDEQSFFTEDPVDEG